MLTLFLCLLCLGTGHGTRGVVVTFSLLPLLFVLGAPFCLGHGAGALLFLLLLQQANKGFKIEIRNRAQKLEVWLFWFLQRKSGGLGTGVFFF
jgi:hypothetical protein